MKRNNYRQKLIDNDNSFQLRNLIIIIFIIAAILIGFYFLTVYVLVNKVDNEPTVQSVIQREKIIFGQMFDRKDFDYYVLAYYSDSQSKNLYNKYLSKYEKKDNHISVYEINLNEVFNKSFVAKKSNIVDNIDKLKISDETLFKINSGKIVEYKVGASNINNYLKKISE